MKFTLRNPADPGRLLHLEGLVDTGAYVSQIPGVLLEQIGITPFGTRRVQYADGTVVSKPVASAEVVIGSDITPTIVLCGAEQDLILIGGLTLEGLSLGVDPVRKTLIPIIPPQASVHAWKMRFTQDRPRSRRPLSLPSPLGRGEGWGEGNHRRLVARPFHLAARTG